MRFGLVSSTKNNSHTLIKSLITSDNLLLLPLIENVELLLKTNIKAVKLV